jgi:hypothetical protein
MVVRVAPLTTTLAGIIGQQELNAETEGTKP